MKKCESHRLCSNEIDWDAREQAFVEGMTSFDIDAALLCPYDKATQSEMFNSWHAGWDKRFNKARIKVWGVMS